MEIRLTRLAEKDIEEIGRYLIKHFPDKAESTYALIEQSCRQLRDYPLIGRPGIVPDTRELKIGSLPYRIIYRITQDSIRILRVYHTSREACF